MVSYYLYLVRMRPPAPSMESSRLGGDVTLAAIHFAVASLPHHKLTLLYFLVELSKVHRGRVLHPSSHTGLMQVHMQSFDTLCQLYTLVGQGSRWSHMLLVFAGDLPFLMLAS